MSSSSTISNSPDVMSDLPFIVQLLARSCGAARRAAREVRKIVQARKLDIIEKDGPKDLQTAADRNSQQSIMATLKQYFPALRVVGEEGNLPELSANESAALVSDEVENTLLERVRANRDKLDKLPFASAPIGEYTVWVDPLDGTNEFTDGAQAEPNSPMRELLEHVTILIGIAHHDEPVAGVIYQPFYTEAARNEQPCSSASDACCDAEHGRLIWVLRHFGFHGVQTQIEKNRAAMPDFDSQTIMVSTRSHDSEVVRDMITGVNPQELLRVGGCGYKLLLLCEQRANCYVYPSKGTKKWDTCAPQCLIEECGGIFTDIFGQRLRYGLGADLVNLNGLLACSSREVYERVSAKVPQTVREAVMKAANQYLDQQH